MLQLSPLLQTAVEIDARGVARLERALHAQVPILAFRYLTFGRVTDHMPPGPFKKLLLLIAGQPDGFDVALEILDMRFYSDRSDKRDHEPELVLAGQELLRRIDFRTIDSSKTYHLAEVAKACLTASAAGPIAAEVAIQLRQAIANYEAHSFENQELLTALLQVQPVPVLNALFSGDEEDRRVGVRVFDDSGDHRANPMDSIPPATLIAWCNLDAEVRYPLAAAIITFDRPAEANVAHAWSEQAVALLMGAPNPEAVLATFIARFRPMSWSGSRAALMEANARLLDSIAPLIPPLGPLAMAAKAQCAQEVAREREFETARDRISDERFE
ncbi:hypothetical protein [Massilia putida]|uniref:hypothetical protein n=1 Tax=Massilia putida TaxID=1141883 RepID=UPI0009526C14|nr:hypothetical protein [Massilia putida]